MLGGFGYSVDGAGATETGETIDDFYVPTTPTEKARRPVALLRPRAAAGASAQIAALHTLIAIVGSIGGFDLIEPSLGLADGERVSIEIAADAGALGACSDGDVVKEAEASRGGGRAVARSARCPTGLEIR